MSTMSPEVLLSLTLSIAATFVSCGVTYGIMKTQIENLKESHSNLLTTLEAIETKYVTKEHFQAVLSPVQDSIKEIRSDIKKILVIVSHKSNDHRDFNER